MISTACGWKTVIGIAAMALTAIPAQASGALIAFVKTDVAQHSDVWTMQANGSGRRRLTSNGKSSAPAWFPDGKHLVYVVKANDSDENGQLWVMDSAGGHVKQLTRSAGWACNDPSVSPDGTQIVFVGIKLSQSPDDQDETYLRVIRGDGSHVRTLNLGDAYYHSPSFMPSAVLYRISGQEPGWGSVKSYSLAANRSRTIYGRDKQAHFFDADDGSETAALSPNGKRIVMTTYGWFAGYSADAEKLRGKPGIVLMNADGTGAKLILAGEYLDCSWSSDGREVLFTSRKSIQTYNLETHQRTVLFRASELYSPVFQPVMGPKKPHR